MPSITLRPVTRENWLACVELTVAPDQTEYIASNVFSLAQAAYQAGLVPLGVYTRLTEGADETLVGFAMYSTLPDEQGRYWIFRLMVGLGYQGRGYGRAMTQAVIERMRAEIPGLRVIALDFHENNHVAEALYESLGFAKTGEREGHEIIASLAI
ncbi:MAG TPA: GNAT family N-acetyltransferase [Ktedonobacterales bacterium]|nr:GNAT family N-acetyltransferase [Ktedonobacterales bacterium]